MKTAVYENYKLTRYEGKGFLRNLNIRLHRDITGEMWFGVNTNFTTGSVFGKQVNIIRNI